MSARVSAEQFFECLRKPINSVTLRRVFLLMMRVHWSDTHNFGDLKDELSCLVYSDEAGSRLDVILDYMFDSKQTTSYPAIILGFGDMTTKKNSLDNYAGISEDYAAKYYALPTSIPLKISHIHSNADTAAAMAESTATFLLGTREPMMQRLNLRAFDITSISAVNLYEKAPSRYFKVEVSAQLDFNMAVTVNLEGHRLKKFGQEFNPEPA